MLCYRHPTSQFASSFGEIMTQDRNDETLKKKAFGNKTALDHLHSGRSCYGIGLLKLLASQET